MLVENEGESLVDTMSTANTMTSGLDYCSPECIMEPSNRTPAGDQYSLGCMLYCCLTGRVPFPEGSAVEKMMAHQTNEPEAITEFAPETPEGLVAIIQRMMAKTPEERFHNCEEIVEALEPFVGEMALAVAAPRQASNTVAKATFGLNGGGLGGNRSTSSMSAAAVATTPAPAQSRVPSAARQSLGFGGGGNGVGMSNKGLNASRGGTATLGPPPAMNTPLPNAPKRNTGMVPSRANFQLPDMSDMPDPDFGPGPEPIGLIPTGVSDHFKDPRFVTAGTEGWAIST